MTSANYQLEANEVTALYQTVLFRAPAPLEISSWASQIDGGGMTLSQAEAAFATSAEAQTVVDPIIRLYQVFFDRAPDAAGLAGWIAAARSGAAIGAIAAQFAHSTEFAGLHSGVVDGAVAASNTAAFVQSLYQNALARTPAAGEVAGWVTFMSGNPSAATTAAVVSAFAQSSEFIADSASSDAGWLAAAAGTSLSQVSATSTGPAIGQGSYYSGSSYGTVSVDVLAPASTVSTVIIADHGNPLSLGGSTSWTIVDANAVPVGYGTAAAPDSHDGLTLIVQVPAAVTAYLSGVGDTIDASTVSFTTAPTLSVSGANSVVKGGAGPETLLATGAHDVVTISPASTGGNTIHVGANASVTLTTQTPTATDIVDVSAPSAHAGSASSSNFALTTIANAHVTAGSATEVVFDAASGAGPIATVDAGSAASLAQALDLAAAATAGAGGIAWFHYAGDTYVVESQAGGAPLAPQDTVVKLAGLLDLTAAVVTAGHHLVL